MIMCTISDIFNSFTNPEIVFGYEDVCCRSTPVPQEAGLYACYFKRFPYKVPVENCITINNLTLLYLGISPAYEDSNNHLRNRIKAHYTRNASASTLRLTIGCLLAEQLNIELRRTGRTERMTFGDGEKDLSEWMAENMFVVWTTADRPWTHEVDIINRISPPLNLKHNENHPFYDTLMNARKQAKIKARNLPVIA